MSLSEKIFRSIDGRYTQLVITCTSHSVDATLFYYEDNRLSGTISHVTRAIQAGENPTEQDIKDQTVDVLEQVCGDIATQSAGLFAQEDLLTDHQGIHQVSIFVSAPWVVQKTYRQETRWNQETTITDQHINALIKDDIAQGYIRLDNQIVSVHLNGYATALDIAVGQSGRVLELSVVDSFMTVDEAETLFQVVHSQLNISEQIFFLLPASSVWMGAISQYCAPTPDSVWASLQGRYTEMACMQNGRLEHSATCPVGIDTIIERMLQTQAAPSATAIRSLLSIDQRGELSQSVQQQLDEIAQTVIDELTQTVAGIATEHPETMARPLKYWYVFTRRDVHRYIVQLMNRRMDGITVLDVHKTVMQAVGYADPQVPLEHWLAGKFLEHHSPLATVR